MTPTEYVVGRVVFPFVDRFLVRALVVFAVVGMPLAMISADAVAMGASVGLAALWAAADLARGKQFGTDTLRDDIEEWWSE